MTDSRKQHPKHLQHPSDPPGSGMVQEPAAAGRPWLQVYFKCSGQYQRVYRNARGDLYIARCGKCGQSVRFAVGAGGTDRRFFEVSC